MSEPRLQMRMPRRPDRHSAGNAGVIVMPRRTDVDYPALTILRLRIGQRGVPRETSFMIAFDDESFRQLVLAGAVEKLVRKIAGSSKDRIILEHARDAAYAAFDLARVRRVKLALIERAFALGTLGTPRLFNSVREAERFLNSVYSVKLCPRLIQSISQR
jgi:hypothetical protein